MQLVDTSLGANTALTAMTNHKFGSKNFISSAKSRGKYQQLEFMAYKMTALN